MLASARLPVPGHRLAAMAGDVHERLERIGLLAEASVAVLDAAMLSLLRGDADAATTLLTRHHDRLHHQVSVLSRLVVVGLASDGPQHLDGVLAEYLARRMSFTLPSLVPALSAYASGTAGRSPHLEIEILGDTLTINGVLIYEQCPAAVTDIFAALYAESSADWDPPLLSATSLALRTNRSAGALAQSVRRFRSVCGTRLRQATGREFGRDAVIQGRPGYRLNPAYLARITMYPPASAREPGRADEADPRQRHSENLFVSGSISARRPNAAIPWYSRSASAVAAVRASCSA